MAFAPPEIDNEEEARVAKAMRTWLLTMITKLKPLKFESRVERGFIERLDIALTAGRAASKQDVQRLKDISWKYRRQLPKHTAPTLPPHDPIVQEMERNGG
jgi:hypothetical protein